MKERLRKLVADTDVRDLDMLIRVVLPILEESSGATQTPVGYVAGAISSDDREIVVHNIERLAQYTEQVRKKSSFPVFSATDIFTDQLYERMRVGEMPKDQRERDFQKFWRLILGSGYVTDLYMTPGWEQSKGATDEHETARTLGINIVYLD